CPSLCLATPPAPTGIYTLSLHDALPISHRHRWRRDRRVRPLGRWRRQLLDLLTLLPRRDGHDRRSTDLLLPGVRQHRRVRGRPRSEEHTSELQSRENLVCRLLLEKKKIK